MPRQYTHLMLIEDKLTELYEAGKTRQEIADELGLSKEQVKNWVYRYHVKQKKIENQIPLNKRGRPRKNPETINPDDPYQKIKLQQKRIKQLEMENELLRDFLFTDGKE